MSCFERTHASLESLNASEGFDLSGASQILILILIFILVLVLVLGYYVPDTNAILILILLFCINGHRLHQCTSHRND